MGYLLTVIFSLSLFAQDHGFITTDSEVSREVIPDTSYLTSSWMTDYHEAMKKAVDEKKMLIIMFGDIDPKKDKEPFLPSDVERLKNFVLLKLPKDHKIKEQGKEIELLKHPAFAAAEGKEGIVMLDFTDDKNRELYGRVVSLLPKNYFKTPNYASHLLHLPPGTLTQRAMVWAIRVHPEKPASTNGIWDPRLVHQASATAEQNARVMVQYHHNNNYMHLNAYEVVAETWPNKTHVVPAALDIVKSWFQTASAPGGGHWASVKGKFRRFGYDMKLGRNGIWYGTGLVYPDRSGRHNMVLDNDKAK